MPRQPKDKQLQALANALKAVKLSGKGAYKKAYPRPVHRKAVSGRGFYKGFGKDVGTFLGGLAGSAVGQQSMGSKLGGLLGQKGADMTGWGSYKLSHNSLVPDIPRIANPKSEGATQIRHCEYIGDVLSSTLFQVQYALPVNAGMPSTFPWASAIANNFTQYQVNGMIFEFRTTSGDATGSNTSLGEVMMATNYDSVLPPFTTKQQMLNQEFSISVKPSNNAIHPIECAPHQTSIELLYTRSQPSPSNTDIRLYDLGQFFLATQGNQSDGQTLGELWISYDILLYKPLLGGDAGVSPPVSGAVSHFRLNNSVQNGGCFTGAVANRNDMSLVITDNSILWPANTPGVFKVDASYYRGFGAYPVQIATNPSGLPVAQPPVFNNNTTNEVSTTVLSTVSVSENSYFYTIPQSDVAVMLVFNAGGTTASGSQWQTGDLFVTQMPSNIN